jgi:hypothetical protein
LLESPFVRKLLARLLYRCSKQLFFRAHCEDFGWVAAKRRVWLYRYQLPTSSNVPHEPDRWRQENKNFRDDKNKSKTFH